MMTLPNDREARKGIPLYRGCLAYFPDALAGVAKQSFKNNETHNPGEPLHHARGKSSDHADCVLRHLSDLGAAVAYYEELFSAPSVGQELDALPIKSMCVQDILNEANAIAWRALALSQELHEKYADAPRAPGARGPR